MTTTPRIILHNVSFRLQQTAVRFDKINLSFEALKYGIVGANGIGKTTLLKLLTGALAPDSGFVQYNGQIIAVPQSHQSIDSNATIGDVLGVRHILQALKRINNGKIAAEDFDQLADYWDIEKRISDALDEPTNNLDRNSRDILYRYIDDSAKAMIIVSHDRTLLNKCNKIVAMTTKGIEVYGGNYDFYKEQKEIEHHALDQEITARTEILLKSKQSIQTRMARHQRNESRAKKGKTKQIKRTGSYNKIEFKSKKGSSERTNRRIRLQANRQLNTANAALSAACARREVQQDFNINLEKTTLPNKKMVLRIENLSFRYNKKDCLINNFNLTMTGPARIAITGPNGCGKSTLIGLIRGLLTPQTGNITLGVDQAVYLDQTVSFLNPHQSIVENFIKHNPSISPFDAYAALAAFHFRNKHAEKNVGLLSGGERMRAGLAISLMSSPAPQFIILDEPTNHLDVDAIEAVENALNCYQGAILAVSHDEIFLQHLGIKTKIVLKS